jgi:hypothetical protein
MQKKQGGERCTRGIPRVALKMSLGKNNLNSSAKENLNRNPFVTNYSFNVTNSRSEECAF